MRPRARRRCSTVHGRGPCDEPHQGGGKKRWSKQAGGFVRVSGGEISREMMMEWVDGKGVELRGAGTDESPQCYKRLDDVLAHHGPTVKIIHTLTPVGVAMAGEDEFDPYKD
ncbi:MAG: hypothetical protein R3C45_20380 [Phycisphaerales bacterium]